MSLVSPETSASDIQTDQISKQDNQGLCNYPKKYES